MGRPHGGREALSHFVMPCCLLVWFLSVGRSSATGPAFVSVVRGGSTVAAEYESQWSAAEVPFDHKYEDLHRAAPKDPQDTPSATSTRTTTVSLKASQSTATPFISVADMASALQWTADVNRLLQRGTASAGASSTATAAASSFMPTSSSSSLNNPLRGGGSVTAALPPQQPYRIPAVSPTRHDDKPSLFHQPSPAAQDLDTYLKSVVDLVGKDADDPQLELCLAMIYLDRATSVETNRYSVAKLPFLDPHTIHHLTLSALVLAASAVRSPRQIQELYRRVRHTLGVDHLERMVEWMHAALGESGVFVTPDELQEWKMIWESKFGPSPSNMDK